MTLKFIFQKIFEYFTAGFLTFLPLAITVMTIKIAGRFIISLFNPLSDYLPYCLKCIPHAEVVFGSLLVCFVGYIIKAFFLYKIIKNIEEALLKKIPFVKHVYFGIKQVIQIFQKKKSDQDNEQVAWVRLPYKGFYCLGFMTGIVDPEISPHPETVYYSFFVPTTPNPVTGYYIIAPATDCIFTTITRQQAMSMVISGGIIKPEKEV